MQVVRKINELCVAPCMVEDEPYGVRTQKMFVIAFAMIAINALFVGVPNTIMQSLADPNAGAYITGFAMAQMSTFSAIIPYLYLRITRDLPPWVADFQMWSTVPMLICLGFFNHQCSSTICNSIIVLVAVVMRVRGWYIIVSIGICTNLVNVLVNDFIEEVPQVHDALFHTQILPVKLLYYIGCHLCPLVFFAGGLFFIMKEFGERSDQADAAIAMNLAVADKLRRYDTDGVAVILAAHKGKVDEKLLEAFAGIQHNLQEYRPHIPDYVIAASAGTEDTDGDGDDDEGGLQDSSRITLLSSRKSHHSVVVSGEPEFLDKSDRKSVSSYSSRHNSTANESEMSRSRDDKYRRSTANSNLTPGQRRTTTMSTSRISSKSGNSPAPKHQHFHGRATTVFVRFVSDSCRNEGGNESIPKEKVGAAISVLNSCVNAASKHAKAYKGALQYMQGCGLMVSFNAASRVATHEANACAFALALKTAVEELARADLVMHATIVTTNVLSFFAGNTGQVMLTVLGGFMSVHTAMHSYLTQTVGKASSCILLGEGVVPTIEMMYDHRLLGAFERRSCRATLPIEKTTTNRSSIVTEPMHNKVKGEQVTISQLIQSSQHDDDEWLYHAAERNENDPITLGNKVVRAALDGDVDQLGTHCDPNDVVLVKCVKERLEQCQEDKAPFSVTVESPTVMW